MKVTLTASALQRLKDKGGRAARDLISYST